MANLRKIAYKPGDNWSPVWNVIQERDCDPHPKKYSLRHPNGSLHSSLRNYKTLYRLMDAAKEEGFNVASLGRHISEVKRKADE